MKAKNKQKKFQITGIRTSLLVLASIGMISMSYADTVGNGNGSEGYAGFALADSQDKLNEVQKKDYTKLSQESKLIEAFNQSAGRIPEERSLNCTEFCDANKSNKFILFNHNYFLGMNGLPSYNYSYSDVYSEDLSRFSFQTLVSKWVTNSGPLLGDTHNIVYNTSVNGKVIHFERDFTVKTGYAVKPFQSTEITEDSLWIEYRQYNKDIIIFAVRPYDIKTHKSKKECIDSHGIGHPVSKDGFCYIGYSWR